MNYVSAGEVCKRFQITHLTLRMWRVLGKIKCLVLSAKKILYDVDSLLGNEVDVDNRMNVMYCRVSTTKLKPDLDNLVELIKNFMLNSGIKVDLIYSEIASGLNDNRLELNKLLMDVNENKVSKIYITFKDRLTRFGFGYFKTFCKLHNTEIIVLDEMEETNKDFQTELTEDLISIIHHYSTKLYANRKKKLKQIENIIKEEN